MRAVLEITYSGVYNRQVIPRLRECFASVTSRCPGVFCACVVVHEREGFRFAANSAELGYPEYSLHWWSGASANARDTGEWTKLVNDLKSRGLPGGLTSACCCRACAPMFLSDSRASRWAPRPPLGSEIPSIPHPGQIQSP